jgi:hypothetical protein
MKQPILLTIALSLAALSRPGAPPSAGIFVLEVPQWRVSVSENAISDLPSSSVDHLVVEVRKSSEEMPPGKIIARVNGEAANIIMSTRSSDQGIVCDLDLNFRPGFLLHSGRNAVEVSAESIYGRPFYATFVLNVRDGPESLREVQRESYVGGRDEHPPKIHLSEPQGVVEGVRELTVSGWIEGGVFPLKLTVNGEGVRLSSSTAATTRGVQIVSSGQAYGFTAPVALSAAQDAIELILTDAHNNREQVRIPVIHAVRSPSQRWAVIIGVSHYRDKQIPQLQFADRDAQEIREMLVDPQRGGVPSDHVLYLANEDATFARIRSALFDFLTKPAPDDLAVVYFAGHGMNDRKKRPDNYYLLGYDTDLDNLSSTAIPMWDLQTAFERTLQANVVTLVDACHSGGIGAAVPNMTNSRWIKAGFGRQRAIITASDMDETSREGDQWGGGHGVFTYYVLQGLLGKADLNHDHKVSVGELFDFVRTQVLRETAGAQSPTAQAGLARAMVLAQAPLTNLNDTGGKR